MLVSAGRGIAFQRRTAAAGISTSTAGAFGAAPAWVKLERRASTISAFQSTDGVNWTLVGSDTFTMAASAYVGLAVSSHDATRLATVTFDNVRVQPATGTPPPPTANLKEIVLYAADATTVTGPWRLEPDTTAAAGTARVESRRRRAEGDHRRGGARGLRRVHVHGRSRTAVSPVDSRQGGARRRGNDSAHVQFSGSVDAQRAPTYRIGTTASAAYVLESCSGCGVADWGWEDNGWGPDVLGPLIYFETTGTQRIRVQNREDGLSFDQIVLSAERFLNSAPGSGETRYDDSAEELSVGRSRLTVRGSPLT